MDDFKISDFINLRSDLIRFYYPDLITDGRSTKLHRHNLIIIWDGLYDTVHYALMIEAFNPSPSTKANFNTIKSKIVYTARHRTSADSDLDEFHAPGPWDVVIEHIYKELQAFIQIRKAQAKDEKIRQENEFIDAWSNFTSKFLNGERPSA